MGVVTYEMEAATTITANRMFNAFALDDTLFPKLLPQAIKGVMNLEGDGGPGTIKEVLFGDASQFKSAKYCVDDLDKEKLIYSYTIIEGDVLMNTLEKISNEIKFEDGPDGGCICKSIIKYYTKDDTEIKEEQIKAGKEKVMGLFKAIEAYLLANPNTYN